MTDADDDVREMGRAATEEVQDAADKTADVAKDTVSKASDAMSDAVGAAAGAVTGAIDAAREEVAAGTRQATELIGGVGDRAITTVKQHPTRTVLLVAGCSMILGLIIGAASAKRR